MRLLLGLLILLLPVTAAAQSWRVSRGDDGIKVGYNEPGSNNFYPIWFRCDPASRQIHVTAAVGERRPASGRGTFTLDGGASPIAITGPVGEFDFDGMFSIETTVARNHPFFALAGDREMQFTSGALRGTLKPTNLKAAVQQFLDGCR